MKDYVSFDLHHLVTLLDKYADGYLVTNFGLSYSRFLVLTAIASLQPTTQHDVAQKIFVGDAVVSRMLPALARAGYVAVTDNPHHARKKMVRLTDEGTRIVHSSSAALEKEFMALANGSNVAVERFSAEIRTMKSILESIA